MTSSKRSRKRVRPLLGTLVEIDLKDPRPLGPLDNAISAAFDAIADVDRLMSFHRADSDLSRLNRARPGDFVSIDPLTLAVLRASNDLFDASDGAFDLRCGQALVDWDFLPPVSRSPAGRANGAASPIEFSGDRVRKTGAWTLDLGGIAKGFAVDRAVAVLEERGVRAGLVNAGGDLRAFGAERWNVAVRHPRFPSRPLSCLSLAFGAVATSGVYFSRTRVGKRWVSPLVRVHDGAPFLKAHSVTVLSESCMMADALTKVVSLAPARAAAVLEKFNARAFLITSRGTISSIH